MTHRAYPADCGPGNGALNWVLLKCDCGWSDERQLSDDDLRAAYKDGVPCDTVNRHPTGQGTLLEDVA